MGKKGVKKNSLFEELSKGSISEIIIERITDSLINGELKPGDKIPTEVEFSENLGIGRNAVREAIKVLVAFGVLEIRRSEGTFVVEEYNQNILNPLVYGLILARDSMEDLLEFKISLLHSTLYLAIRNATDDELKVLRKYWEKFSDAMYEEPANIEKIYQRSKIFNEYIGIMSKNPMLVHLAEIMVKIGMYSRRKAIEMAIFKDQRYLLPDLYLKQVELIEKREKNKIASLTDTILEAWCNLLLEDTLDKHKTAQ